MLRPNAESVFAAKTGTGAAQNAITSTFGVGSMTRASFWFIALLSAAAVPSVCIAAPKSVPLPPPKPPEIARPPHGAAPSQKAAPHAKEPKEEEQTEAKEAPKEPTPGELCLERLKAAGFQFEPAASPGGSNSACVIDTPVRLKAVGVAGRPGLTVRFLDEPLLACRFGERLGHWVTELAAPLLATRMASEVKAVRTGPGYECRNRNRASNGKLSAHALGLAVDIAGFELANGKTLLVKPNGDERMRAAMTAIRIAACGWFLTVLGPGSDAAHADHMHLDLQQHGSSDRYRICQ
jgi:hypothetical protein